MGAVGRDRTGEVAAELCGAAHTPTTSRSHSGLLAALDWCREHGATNVQHQVGLVAARQQMKGVYKVKNEGLNRSGRGPTALPQIGKVTFEHVRRELNKEADKLANLAMDQPRTRTSPEGRTSLRLLDSVHVRSQHASAAIRTRARASGRRVGDKKLRKPRDLHRMPRDRVSEHAGFRGSVPCTRCGSIEPVATALNPRAPNAD